MQPVGALRSDRTAQEHCRQKAQYDFIYRIAVLGYYPDELASGQLRPGSKIAGGRVIRPQPSSVDDATIERAAKARGQLVEQRVEIDPVLKGNLEAVAFGRWHGSARTAESAIVAAENAVRKQIAQREAAATEAAERPMLTVHVAFRAAGARQFDQGCYPIDPETADILRDWQEKMEAQAQAHGWDAPVGYGSGKSWPPFELR